MADANTRATVHYTGWVQGVGFRWRACREADEHPVTGYVRNLADGRVEMVAEGVRGEVETFLEALGARLARHIESQAVEWSDATRELGSFDVRR